MRHAIVLFGEAEKGDFCTPIYCKSLPQMVDALGHPPQDTRGLYYAVQALLYDRELFFFRVKEEGFSRTDYMRGLKLLQSNELFMPLTAICMPGMGDSEIIHATHSICELYKSFLIIDERDFYDYLTTKIIP